MNSSPTLSVAAPGSDAAGLGADLRRAIDRVTWRVFGATLAIAAALNLWSVIELALQRGPKLPSSEAYASATVVNIAMSFTIMLATLVADEGVARGARRARAYAWAVVIGCAMGTLVQWLAHQSLHLRWHSDLPSVPPEVTVMQPAFVFFEYLIWGSMIVFIYASRRSALLAMARRNAAQLERSAAQRRMLESRLQVLQARVEPQFLFTTLAQVHELYESDSPKASCLLGNLIVYLRAALPQLRESAATLGEELDLATAYLDVINVHGNERLAVAIDAADDIRLVRMPPMILLPLIGHAIAHASAAGGTSGGSIRIAAHNTTGRLRVEIVYSCEGWIAPAERRELADIRERLTVLYGAAATLGCELSGNRGFHLTIEIPLE